MSGSVALETFPRSTSVVGGDVKVRLTNRDWFKEQWLTIARWCVNDGEGQCVVGAFSGSPSCGSLLGATQAALEARANGLEMFGVFNGQWGVRLEGST